MSDSFQQYGLNEELVKLNRGIDGANLISSHKLPSLWNLYWEKCLIRRFTKH